MEAAHLTYYTSPSILLHSSGIDDYTVLMLNCEGSDEGTTFRDSSSSAHSVTANGTAQIDTAQYKFGGGSCLLDGDSDYLSVADSADWFFDSGALTIEMWFRLNDYPASGYNAPLFSQKQDANNRADFWYANLGSSKRFEFRIISAASTIVSVFASSSTTISTDTWYHVALIRGWGGNANDWAVTVNGTQSGSTVTDDSAWPDLTEDVNIGYQVSAVTSYLNGWIDEYRISKGIARWTENFTPPSTPYKRLLP